MNEKQSKRADRFTRRVTNAFPHEPVVFGVQPTSLRGVTVSAFNSDEGAPLATMYINQQGEGSLRAPGMGAKQRGKIRG
jgi:hypothetical protein